MNFYKFPQTGAFIVTRSQLALGPAEPIAGRLPRAARPLPILFAEFLALAAAAAGAE